MKELKLLLACGVLFGMTAGIAACDVDDGEGDCEVGDCTETDGGAGGMGGMGGGMVETEYRYVIIVDDSPETDTDGTAGVDICGMVANCNGAELTGVGADLSLGEGEVCDGNTTEAPCSSGVNRQNPGTALDTGALCDPATNNEEPSHYVSIGVGGELAVEFDQDLQGCDVEVIEHAGRDAEAYRVYVCESNEINNDTCLLMANAVAEADMGGPVSFTVPTAQ